MSLEMIWDNYMYGLRVKTRTKRFNILCMGNQARWMFFTGFIGGTLGEAGEYGY